MLFLLAVLGWQVAASGGCGRTGLDDTAPDGGAGGRAVTGTGGRGAGGGAGGMGGGFALPPTPGLLLCGTEICLAGAQTCCIGAGPGAVSSKCIAASATCAGTASLACDEPADCRTGELCCAGINPAGGALLQSSCVPKNACAGIARFVVCRQDGDCPASAPSCCAGLGVPLCQSRCGN